jgi:miniconductance mechanosensitive channel
MNLEESLVGFAADHPLLAQLLKLLGLAVAGWIANAVAGRWMLAAVRRFAERSRASWDDAMVAAQVFQRFANLAPILVVYFGVDAVGIADELALVLQRVALALMVVSAGAIVSALLTSANTVYAEVPDAGNRPIKGYLSFVRLLVFGLCGLLALSLLMDRSPWIFLSGLGAMTAVLLIVFKDTLLSLVASLQITSNRLIHIGDWVEMPQYGADGDVIDVALHTVKIQNWDKTITTVPTHAFISGSFKNWRGMSESNSRRIKRSIFIDIGSIRFLKGDEIDQIERFSLLHDYVAAKRDEIREYNADPGRDETINADIRRLTNIGTFRAYMLNYLKNHPKIHQDLTLIVRQLKPCAEGLPIEIYCFVNDIAWANYEDIQADIFDHFFSIAPEFGIKIFQSPSGTDLAGFAREAQAG